MWSIVEVSRYEAHAAGRCRDPLTTPEMPARCRYADNRRARTAFPAPDPAVFRRVGGAPAARPATLADRVGRKHLIVTGMLVQAADFVRVPALLDTPLVRIGAGVEGRAVSGQGSTFRC